VSERERERERELLREREREREREISSGQILFLVPSYVAGSWLELGLRAWNGVEDWD
jgi:hypothetical protein